jgi:hypothetical protein
VKVNQYFLHQHHQLIILYDYYKLLMSSTATATTMDEIAFTSPPVLCFVDSHVCLQATVRSELAIYNKDFSTNAC